MNSTGVHIPESVSDVRDQYEEVGPLAQIVVREVAVAMGFDQEEYQRRVSEAVVATARDALFAGRLTVHTGGYDVFQDWLDEPPQAAYELELEGSENVDSVAWHPAPADERILAATYQNEPQAAVATVRRLSWGRIYEPLLTEP